ncbi:MAG: ferric reductase-like transmembrane domain-containing protein [Beijerinckiaceae bacterium]|nr:ferric reductase-like transmembrane domain-containing protein [Beijerinckiaceae bacterium]
MQSPDCAFSRDFIHVKDVCVPRRRNLETALFPWNDRKGRLAPLKLIVFASLFLPGLWVAFQWWQGDLAPKPVTEALHQTGAWTVRLLLLSLAITPVRSIAHWPRLVDVRRMVGLGALAYVLIHLGLYVVDQKYDLWRVVSEIALRFYLTIGFLALLGLVALGVTSTDAMVARLGAQRWNRLHSVVYLLAVLSLFHAFLQARLDVSEPVLMTGLFVALMGYRFMHARQWRGPLALAGLAVFAGLATALIEAAWYGVKTGVDVSRVLAANLAVDVAIRPSLWVFAIVLALVPLRFLGRARAPAGRAAPVRPASAR